MKSIIQFLSTIAAIFFISACGPANTQNGNIGEVKDSVKQIEEHHHEGDGISLTLNNGVKWKADSITNANVSVLINIVIKNNPVSLDDYHTTAQLIKEGVNKLLQDCKMQGPDHEALHHWLVPLLEKNKELGKSTSIEEAGKIFAEEKEHLGIYQNYFQ